MIHTANEERATRGDMIQQEDSEAGTCKRRQCFYYSDWSWKVTPPVDNTKMAKINFSQGCDSKV